MRRLTLVSLAVLYVCLLLPPGGVLAQQIQIRGTETIRIDPEANFQDTPRSFCFTEDRIFLIPDHKTGAIKVFNKEGNFLKFIKSFNGSETGDESLIQPMYCAYNREENQVAVIDNGARKIFLFYRFGKVDFRLIKTFLCRRGGYDIEFAGNGKQLVVSGFLEDEENNPFDVYRIDTASGQIDYLLPSPQKYGLQTKDEYLSEYRIKQTIPSVGTRAFITVQKEDLFFIWEGALRIIKLNLNTQKPEKTFGHEAAAYTKPNQLILGNSYAKGDFQTTWDEQKKAAYIRNIFSSTEYLYVAFEIAQNNMSNASRYWLQVYNLEGAHITTVPFPGNPGKQMCFDAENGELYAFSEQSGNGNRELSVLKYSISR